MESPTHAPRRSYCRRAAAPVVALETVLEKACASNRLDVLGFLVDECGVDSGEMVKGEGMGEVLDWLNHRPPPTSTPLPMSAVTLETVFEKACASSRLDVLGFLVGECGVDAGEMVEVETVGVVAFGGRCGVEMLDWLEGVGVDVGCVVCGGRTALGVACGGGWTDGVRRLVEGGANVHDGGDECAAPLYEASLAGDCDVVRTLLDVGAEVDVGRTDGHTPLCIASQTGYVECVSVLIEAGADVDNAAADGRTALYGASENAHVDCVSALVEAGADVNKARTSDGRTPLFVASLRGHIECVSAVLGARADVDKASTADSSTPLFAASQKGHIDCVLALIAAGADVEKARIEGSTPLYMASANGHSACVSALIAAGADVERETTATSSTPLFMASFGGHIDCVSALIGAGADVNKARTIDGCTPLFIACKQGCTDCASALIGAGADVDTELPSEFTPLYIASEYGRNDCVLALIGAGADVDKAKASDGRTPLHAASNQAHARIVAALLAAGANPVAPATDGTTPSAVAAKAQRPGVFALLASRGAVADVSSVAGGVVKRQQWEALAPRSEACGGRLVLWCLGRSYGGVVGCWARYEGVGAVLRTVEALCKAMAADRLECLEVLGASWRAHGGVVSDGEAPGLAGVCRALRHRRMCRVVEGKGLVEPFGQAVVAFL